MAGQQLKALLNLGSMISMIQADLVLAGLPLLHWSQVSCLSRLALYWPVQAVSMILEEQPTIIEMGHVEKLPYPALLGWDLPSFWDLLHQATVPAQVCLRDKERETEPDSEGAGEGGSLPYQEMVDPQSPPFRKPKKWRILEVVAVSEGQVVDPQKAQ